MAEAGEQGARYLGAEASEQGVLIMQLPYWLLFGCRVLWQ